MKRILCFALLFLAAGCATSPTPPIVEEELPALEKDVTIAVIPKALDNPVFAYPRQGALTMAAKLGHVAIRWEAPARFNPTEQAALVGSLTEQGVDGFLISCADPEILRPAIDQAAEKGIPVVTFDSDAPQSKHACFYGVNDEKLGRRLGEEMVKLLGKKGRVALLSGSKNALNLQQRCQGVMEALARHPDITVINTYYCNDDIALSAKILAAVTPVQKPDGWIMVGGWPLFTEHGLDPIPAGDIKIVAVDPLPECWRWIEDGHVQVCLGQKVFGWGEDGIKLVVKAIQGKSLPAFIDSGFDVVTPENLGDYKKNWEKSSHVPSAAVAK